VVKKDFLLRISIVCLQLRWIHQKNPQRISEDTLPVFSSPPPCFVKTLAMLTTEPFFTTLLGYPENASCGADLRNLPKTLTNIGFPHYYATHNPGIFADFDPGRPRYPCKLKE
jgi:hypothetical protein